MFVKYTCICPYLTEVNEVENIGHSYVILYMDNAHPDVSTYEH